MLLFIENNVSFHYEILESLVVKYKEIIGNVPVDTIYLFIHPNDEFQKYVMKKYPHIRFGKPTGYDYYISATLYPSEYGKLAKKPNHFYISHRVSDVYNGDRNVFYLTPLSRYNVFQADILPYSDRPVQTEEPIYVVQGSIERRNLHMLEKILAVDRPFRVKVIGRDIPTTFTKYAHKLLICKDYGWSSYHQEFSNCYCILPLISKQSHPQYYIDTLTSTINYARGYKLKCLLDKDLQNIYGLERAEVFEGEHDIVEKFCKTLDEFSTSKRGHKSPVNMCIPTKMSSWALNKRVVKKRPPVVVTPRNISYNYSVDASVDTSSPGYTVVYTPGYSVDYRVTYNARVIPLNLFQTWSSLELPPKMKDNVDMLRAQNPEFSYFLYDDAMCAKFIDEYFTEEIVYTFHKLKPGAYKADLWRYCVLYIYGGIYLDIKYFCVDGFRLIQLTDKEYYAKDKYHMDDIGIYQAILVSLPNNTILLKCIQKIVENVKHNYYGVTTLESTGPQLVRSFFKPYEIHKLQLSIADTGNDILYSGKTVLKVYNGYREEQKFVQVHYSTLWRMRDIYIYPILQSSSTIDFTKTMYKTLGGRNLEFRSRSFSIIAHQDKYMACVCWASKQHVSMLSNCILDKSLVKRSERFIDDARIPADIQDVVLYVHKDEVFYSANCLEGSRKRAYCYGKYVGEVMENTIAKALWSYIGYNNELCCVYSWFPLVIGREDGTIHDIRYNLPDYFREVVYATPGVMYENEIWVVLKKAQVYNENDGNYYNSQHFIAIFDPLMNLVKYSEMFKFEESSDEVCLGMVMEPERTLIAYRSMDKLKLGVYTSFVKDLRWYYDTNSKEYTHKMFTEVDHPMYGSCSVITADTAISKWIMEGCVWDEDILHLLCQHMKSDTTVIDVGAYIGPHTMGMIRKLYSGTIVAFEPQPFVFSLLQQNVTTATTDTEVRAELHMCGLSDAERVVYMTMPNYYTEGNPGGYGVEFDDTYSKGKTKVLIRTLDSFGYKQVSVIKIKVAGHEPHVLRGAADTIRGSKPVIIVEILGGVPRERADETQLKHIDDTIDYIRGFEYSVELIAHSVYLCLPNS